MYSIDLVLNTNISHVQESLDELNKPITNLNNEDRLTLCDEYYKLDMLDNTSKVLLLSDQFRDVAKLQDDIIFEETGDYDMFRSEAIYLIYYRRYNVRMIVNKIPAKYTRFTIVYCDPKYADRIDGKYIKLLKDNNVLFKFNLPYYKETDDGIVLTFDVDEAEDLINKYGLYCKIVIMYEHIDKMSLISYPENITIVAHDMDEFVEFVTADYNESVSQLSYMISGTSGSNMLQEHKCLRSWKLIYPINGVYPKYVDYIQIYSKISRERRFRRDRNTFYIPCTIKNLVDTDTNTLFKKHNLFEFMKSNFEDYYTFMPMTIQLKDLKSYADWKFGTMIIKPSGKLVASGIGITVANNEEQFNLGVSVIEDYNRDVKDKDNEWVGIVSKYIDNPLLIEGKKFHFRSYIVVTSWGKIISYPIHSAYTAKLPYRNEDYLNKEIHDTHFKTTSRQILFPYDFYDEYSNEDVERIRNALESVIDRVKISFRGKVIPYEECKLAYEILGTDIIVDDQFNGWLIEVNTMPGMTPHGTDTKKSYMYYDEFLKWKYTNIISPIETLLMPLKIVRFESSSTEMRDELSQITRDMYIMRYIGKGELWSRNDIEKIYDHSVEDSIKGDRKYFDWIITEHDSVIGYISLKPMIDIKDKLFKNGDLQIRIFIKSQGHGYGRRAMNVALEQMRNNGYKGRIWSLVNVDNDQGNKFFNKLVTEVLAEKKADPRSKPIPTEWNKLSKPKFVYGGMYNIYYTV